MAKYECKVCGYIYNEQHAGRTFDELNECPICNESKSNFVMLEEEKPVNIFRIDSDEEIDNTDIGAYRINSEEEKKENFFSINSEESKEDKNENLFVINADSDDDNFFTVNHNADAKENVFSINSNEDVKENVFSINSNEDVKENVFSINSNEDVKENVFSINSNEDVKENVFAINSNEDVKENVFSINSNEDVKENVFTINSNEDVKENVFSINSSEDDKKEAEEKIAEREETPEYVVERRQEFWSPFSVTAEKDEPKSTNTTGWTISNARSAVETVIGAPEEVKEETSAYVKTEDELPAYESRIESFYSTATPVTASHIVADEQESFKPLWNTTGGTVQRVIDSFGDKNESVVKAENIDMVVPAEEPIVEEILGEELDENVAETVAVESETVVAQEETTVEEVQEAAEEETAVEEAQEATEEETAVEEAQEAAEEETAEEVQEAAEEETAVEEVQEAAEATVEEKAANPYEFWDEDDDDDFFTEVTMDAVVEENEEAADSVVMAEDSVEEIVDVKAEADDFVEEDTETEAEAEDFVVENVETEAEADDFVVENVETEAEADDFVVENIETEAEAEDFVVENIETEAEADDFVEETVDAEAKEDILAEESADDNVSTVAEELEAAQKDDTPKVKAWSFLDDMVEVSTAAGVAAAGVAGVTFVTKAMDEVVDEEVTDEDIEEVFVDFADSDLPQNVYKANLAEELFGADIVEKQDATEAVNSEKVAADAVEETVEAVAEAKDDLAEADNAETEEKTVTYDNNLEKILILPAQLNPMPLPEDTFIEGKTILGIGAERPLVLDNPVFSTGAYNMVQYIPNTGLTSEDYQQADAIEIVVGHGNGIEKNINSKEDLRQVVNFLRLESDGCPIGIKLGAARIERDLEFCIFAKPDYVVLNNFSVVPLPYALHRAMKFLNTVQSDIDIVIALDGVKDGEELAKIMAMGADVIALRNRPADMDGVIDELKKYARITGHYDVEDLNVKDLCTIDREIAEFTDIYHV